MQGPSLIDEIAEFARNMRIALEPGLLKNERGDAISEGSCLYASVLVASSINRYCLASAVICGGGDGFAGARDKHGELQGHYWVKATLKDGGVVIVDITADQFGHEPVRVLPLVDAKPWYVAGPQGIVDDAARELGEQFDLMDTLRF